MRRVESERLHRPPVPNSLLRAIGSAVFMYLSHLSGRCLCIIHLHVQHQRTAFARNADNCIRVLDDRLLFSSSILLLLRLAFLSIRYRNVYKCANAFMTFLIQYCPSIPLVGYL